MRKRIIAWVLLVLSAAIMYFFSNGSVTLALLVALIAALPLSYAMLRLTADKTELSVSEAVTEEGKRKYVLSFRNKGILPVAAVETDVLCANLRNGGTDTHHINMSLGPHASRNIEIEMDPPHAGRYEFTAGQLRIMDHLGIWSRKAGAEYRTGFTVMPDIYDIRMASAAVAAMPESDMESNKTRGTVSGDTVDIREYVPGDPVSNIHWKLSEKTDKLLVRELGSPQSDQYLLILDNAADAAHDTEALDAVASVYASVIHALIQNDMVCYAAWTDPESGRAVIKRVADEDEENEAADSYLSMPVSLPSAFASISRDLADDRYVHVVIVGSRIPQNIDVLSNGCQATVLRYGEQGTVTEGSLTVVGFQTSTYREDTAGIEI